MLDKSIGKSSNKVFETKEQEVKLFYPEYSLKRKGLKGQFNNQFFFIRNFFYSYQKNFENFRAKKKFPLTA